MKRIIDIHLRFSETVCYRLQTYGFLNIGARFLSMIE